jgi:hypothetical protein
MGVNVIVKDVEVDAGKVLSFLAKTEKTTPQAVAGLAVVLGAVGKAVSDVQSVAAAPTQALNVTFDQQTAADVKAVWPALKEFAASFGIKL